ncbi:MAG TPA: hypothetical protein DCQ29_03785 [Chitinophagaceae bacterium]|nr:hypothetical protein [Chitinophagaceae bacterium]
MKQILLAAFAACTLVACNVNYETSPSGLKYKIHKGKGGEKLQAGQFVQLNIEYKIDGKDSILQSTYGKLPMFTNIDTSANARYSFMEVIPKMNVGDSGQFVMSVDTLKSRGFIADYNDIFKRGGLILGRFHVIAAYKTEAEVTAAFQAAMDKEKANSVAQLEAYLTKKGIKAQKTKSGAFVVVTNPGNTAMLADSGTTASVMYRGTLLTTGKVFDTNLDASKGHTDPIDVNVGQRQVIVGWDEALPFFGMGGKGTIYVPSMLGYGAQSPSPEIPPYSDLVFEIEIKNVKPAPPAPKQFSMIDSLKASGK